MLKIAVWYDNHSTGRNDGNPLYLTAFLKRAQRYIDEIFELSVNHDLDRYFNTDSDPQAKKFAEWFVREFGTGFRCFHLVPFNYKGEYGKFDLNIWVDWGEDGLKNILSYDVEWPESPVVYWASDTHLGYDYRLMRAKQSDIVFCAQSRAVQEFKRDGVEEFVLPHSVEPFAYPKFNLASKKHDICFVGHVNNEKRMNVLDRMFGEFPNFFYGQRRFEDAARKYAESKIVLNPAMLDDLNMRCFEVMASGAFLLTDDIPMIHDYFEDKKHLVLYRNLDEAVQLARFYLEHDEERERIAKQGYEYVIGNHTFYHRILKMFQTVKEKEIFKCQATQVS